MLFQSGRERGKGSRSPRIVIHQRFPEENTTKPQLSTSLHYGKQAGVMPRGSRVCGRGCEGSFMAPLAGVAALLLAALCRDHDTVRREVFAAVLQIVLDGLAKEAGGFFVHDLGQGRFMFGRHDE